MVNNTINARKSKKRDSFSIYHVSARVSTRS